MPVLEVCLLRLKSGTSASDESLLRNLAAVRSRLKTNSQFYHCIDDPSLLYILGMWPNLEAHHNFLTSPEKEEILGPQEDQLDFEWMLHVELDTMSAIPSDAPVMSIARIFLSADKSAHAYNTAADSYTQAIVEATKPYQVVRAERCDPNLTAPEVLVLSGWNRIEDHASFRAKARENEEFNVVREVFTRVEVRHVRNMEKP